MYRVVWHMGCGSELCFDVRPHSIVRLYRKRHGIKKLPVDFHQEFWVQYT